MLQSKLEEDKNNEVVVDVDLSVSRHKNLINLVFMNLMELCEFFCDEFGIYMDANRIYIYRSLFYSF